MYRQKRDFCTGRLPSPWQPFVVLVGPVAPTQLSMFVREFCSLRGTEESQTHFVLLSPLELSHYAELMAASSFSRRIYLQHGDVIGHCALGARNALPIDVRRAKAIFLFSNTMDWDPLAGLHEDSATLVRTLVLRKLLSEALMPRISLQLNHAREKRLAIDLGVNAAIALDELKMGLLALSATRCFGLTTLFANLLYSYTTPFEAAARHTVRWRNEYLFGVSHESYQVTLPPCYAGYKWREVVGSVFAALGVTLLARVVALPADDSDPLDSEPLEAPALGDERAVDAGAMPTGVWRYTRNSTMRSLSHRHATSIMRLSSALLRQRSSSMASLHSTSTKSVVNNPTTEPGGHVADETVAGRHGADLPGEPSAPAAVLAAASGVPPHLQAAAASERRRHRACSEADGPEQPLDWWLDIDPCAEDLTGESCVVLALACSQTHLDMVLNITDDELRQYVEAYDSRKQAVSSAEHASVHSQWEAHVKRERTRDLQRFSNLQRWKRACRASKGRCERRPSQTADAAPVRDTVTSSEKRSGGDGGDSSDGRVQERTRERGKGSVGDEAEPAGAPERPVATKLGEDPTPSVGTGRINISTSDIQPDEGDRPACDVEHSGLTGPS